MPASAPIEGVQTDATRDFLVSFPADRLVAAPMEK